MERYLRTSGPGKNESDRVPQPADGVQWVMPTDTDEGASQNSRSASIRALGESMVEENVDTDVCPEEHTTTFAAAGSGRPLPGGTSDTIVVPHTGHFENKPGMGFSPLPVSQYVEKSWVSRPLCSSG